MIITKDKVLHITLNATMHCNLRCVYCYVEKDNQCAILDMTTDEITSFYKWISEYANLIGSTEIHFLWFGGEPFLLSPAFLEEQIQKQEILISKDLRVKNIIHSNLTLINPQNIELLKRYFNGEITGSYDYGSNLRQFPDGRDACKQIEEGIQILQENGIAIEINCTITKNNEFLAEPMYEFFKSRKIDFHVNMGSNFGQKKPPEYFLTVSQYNKTVLKLFQIYTSDPNPGITFRNFDSMVSSFLHGEVLGCSMITHCGFELSVKYGGILFTSCPYISNLGNFKIDSPQMIYDRIYTFANQTKGIHSGCMEKCPHHRKICGICPMESDKNCFTSHCGCRISLNRELWDYVEAFLTANGLSYGCMKIR